MRNCEQILGSLGLFACHLGSLDKLNEALSRYGPENLWAFPRVTIKERKGQQTEIDRTNIKVALFSGMDVDCHILVSIIRRNFISFLWYYAVFIPLICL